MQYFIFGYNISALWCKSSTGVSHRLIQLEEFLHNVEKRKFKACSGDQKLWDLERYQMGLPFKSSYLNSWFAPTDLNKKILNKYKCHANDRKIKVKC